MTPLAPVKIENREYFIDELLKNPQKVSDSVTIAGWVQFIRAHGKIMFLTIRDGTGEIQISCKQDLIGHETYTLLETLTLESTLLITGNLKQDHRAPNGYELGATSIDIISIAEEWPIPKNAGPGFLFENRHLHIRTPRQRGILFLRSQLVVISREWLQLKGYVEIHPPMIITAAVEGGATLFPLRYFDKDAFLTQSSQFYLEAAIPSFDHVYCFSPSFRAEKSHTNKHLAEFWHLELEDAFTTLSDTLNIQEDFVSSVIQEMVARHEVLIKELGGDPSALKKITTPFARYTYDEAITILHDKGSNIHWGDDIGTRDELLLTKDQNKPIFVTHYPRKIKAFYHMLDPKNMKYALCADMLLPNGNGELIGGGQRIHEKSELLDQIQKANLDPKDYNWYIDLRRYGTQPHTGFGLGMARFLRFILQLPHIREAIPFPRTMTRVHP